MTISYIGGHTSHKALFGALHGRRKNTEKNRHSESEKGWGGVVVWRECAWVPWWHISQIWVSNTDPGQTCRYTFTAPGAFHSDDTHASDTSNSAVVSVCGRGTWFAYALAMAMCCNPSPVEKDSYWSTLAEARAASVSEADQ